MPLITAKVPDTVFRSGYYYHGFGPHAQVDNTPIADTLLLWPFKVDIATWFDSISCYVSSAGVLSSCRLGVYASDVYNVPRYLVVDSGDIDTTTTGAKTITFPGDGILLYRMKYYVAFVAHAGIGGTVATMRARGSVSDGYSVYWEDVNNASRTGLFKVNDVSGALPSTIDPVPGSANFPHVLLHAK